MRAFSRAIGLSAQVFGLGSPEPVPEQCHFGDIESNVA
jgi:hypothetical protein